MQFRDELSVLFLGHVVSSAGVQPDPTKVEVVAKYPMPTNKKAVRRFFGAMLVLPTNYEERRPHCSSSDPHYTGQHVAWLLD